MLRVPHVPPTPTGQSSAMFGAMRDLPFEHTEAPRALVSVLMVLNTGVVIAGQVLVARRVATVGAAIRANVLAGVLLLLCCLAFGASGSAQVALAVVLLCLAALLQVAAEL